MHSQVLTIHVANCVPTVLRNHKFAIEALHETLSRIALLRTSIAVERTSIAHFHYSGLPMRNSIADFRISYGVNCNGMTLLGHRSVNCNAHCIIANFHCSRADFHCTLPLQWASNAEFHCGFPDFIRRKLQWDDPSRPPYACHVVQPEAIEFLMVK